MILKNKNLVIFGTGKIAEAVSYFFERDSDYNLVAYVVDDEFAVNESFLSKPVIKKSLFLKTYSKDDIYLFVALGYQGINKLRKDRYLEFKNIGYKFASYVSPFVISKFEIGENTIVMDGTVLQPIINIGNNVFIWGGTMIGHHAIIHDNVWLTGGALIGGGVTIGDSTFIGMGAIIGQEVILGNQCMIGAGALIVRNIDDKSVILIPQSDIHRLNSDQFSRMSSCFQI